MTLTAWCYQWSTRRFYNFGRDVVYICMMAFMFFLCNLQISNRSGPVELAFPSTSRSISSVRADSWSKRRKLCGRGLLLLLLCNFDITVHNANNAINCMPTYANNVYKKYSTGYETRSGGGMNSRARTTLKWILSCSRRVTNSRFQFLGAQGEYISDSWHEEI